MVRVHTCIDLYLCLLGFDRGEKSVIQAGGDGGFTSTPFPCATIRPSHDPETANQLQASGQTLHLHYS